MANKGQQNKMDDNVPVSLIRHFLGDYDEEIGRLLRNENDFGFVETSDVEKSRESHI